MQDKTIVHVLTRDEFDIKLLDVKGSQRQMQQDIQDLLNVAVAYASDPKCNDFTFGTKLYKACQKGVKGEKVRGAFELYGGAMWDKDGAEGGQFKKDRNGTPDAFACGQAQNAWWNLEKKVESKPWDAHAFFTRTTKTVNTKGSKDEFKRNNAEQLALDALISSLHNEGFEINIPESRYKRDDSSTQEIPDWEKNVEEKLAA